MSRHNSDVHVLQQQVQAVRSGGPPPRQLRGNGPAPRGEDTAYKIALLGPLQAGKTKIASQICNISFPNKYEPTAGVRYVFSTKATTTGQLQLGWLAGWKADPIHSFTEELSSAATDEAVARRIALSVCRSGASFCSS